MPDAVARTPDGLDGGLELMGGSTVEFVEDRTRFADIAPQWSELWRATNLPLFQSRDWIDAWWASLPPDAVERPRVGLAWRGNELVAALPLSFRRWRGLRTLEWAAKEVSDYCDVLAAPGQVGDDAAADLWSATIREGSFDLAYLSHLLPDARMRAVLDGRSAPWSGPRMRASARHDVNYRITAPWSSGGAWLGGQPRRTRQNYRRGLSALSGLGVVRTRRVDDPDFDPLLERLIHLKQLWLDRTGRSSPLLEANGAMLRRLTEAARRQSAVQLFVIEADDRLLAGALNLVEGGSMRTFFAAYDGTIARGSAGIMLIMDYIQRAYDEGYREIDFLCGGEEYKRRLADSARTLGALVGGRTVAGKAAIAADGAWRRYRGWRNGVTGPSIPA